MPNIKPISDLRNYTDVLKEVDISSRVYLTRNGRGEYGILTMEEIDELDRLKAIYTLNKKLQEAEDEAEREGWISEEDLKKELGVQKIDNKIFTCGKEKACTDEENNRFR